MSLTEFYASGTFIDQNIELGDWGVFPAPRLNKRCGFFKNFQDAIVYVMQGYSDL